MKKEFDFVVIGGGIAGTAAAAELAGNGSVCLIEMEDDLGYHSTGRSAALFSEAYGNDVIRALTIASRSCFYEPDRSIFTTDLVRPRNILMLAREGQSEALDIFLEQTAPIERVDRITADEAVAMCPIVRPEMLVGAAVGRRTADIEVHELHQGFQRQLKANRGTIVTGAPVTALAHDGSKWRIETGKGVVSAPVVVNAAGAWANELGRMAGARDIGLRALKRTACLVPAPPGVAVDGWPMVVNVEEEFYLKPDAGLLLLSPADETPSEPGDAHAEELEVAIAIDHVQRATTLEVRTVKHRWAGLRSFVADSSPVIGFDDRVPGFFWVAALGGFGIQTAPAIGRISGSLAAGRPIDAEILDLGVDPTAIAVDRDYSALESAHRIGVSRT